MPIYIKNKYTKTEDFTAKQGMFDAKPIIVKIGENGSVSGDTNIFLGYSGEHNTRIINVDTTNLNWGTLMAEQPGDSEVEIHELYTPVLIFNRITESDKFTIKNPCILTMGWDEDPEKHTCTSVSIPGEFLMDEASYEVVFTLQEKNDEFHGNIIDSEANLEVFVSDIFKAYVKPSAKEYFSNSQEVSYLLLDGSIFEEAGVRKPKITISYEEGQLKTNNTIDLGMQGDVYVTEIEILLSDLFNSTMSYKILFYNEENNKRYHINEWFYNGGLPFWVPKEVTQISGDWQIACYFSGTINGTVVQGYSPFIAAKVKDSFIENGLGDIESIEIFSIEALFSPATPGSAFFIDETLE